jgi:predicted nucleic acid-binding protein
MITLKINKVPTLFIKAFAAADVQKILEFVRQSAVFYAGSSNRILFIDTPITSATVEAVEKLVAERYRVVFRDHHGIDGEPNNDRDKQVIAAANRLKNLLGDDCHMTAAMKAAGISYEGLDDDAAKLDGEPKLQVTGTEISQLLAKGIATIPSYDSSRPKDREIAHQKLFADWLKAVTGDAAARQRLEQNAELYQEAVEVSRQLVLGAVEVAPGIMLVDVADKPLFDPGTLYALLEDNPACRITVLRKSLGPIAAHHGIQYSLSVAREHKDQINLQNLLPKDSKSDPELGVISNTSFLLHVSEDVWRNQICPSLVSGQIFPLSRK